MCLSKRFVHMCLYQSGLSMTPQCMVFPTIHQAFHFPNILRGLQMNTSTHTALKPQKHVKADPTCRHWPPLLIGRAVCMHAIISAAGEQQECECLLYNCQVCNFMQCSDNGFVCVFVYVGCVLHTILVFKMFKQT